MPILASPSSRLTSRQYRALQRQLKNDQELWDENSEITSFGFQVQRLFANAASEVCKPMGNLSKFMYAGPDFEGDAVDGAGLFEKLCAHPDYYLRNGESTVIRRNLKALTQRIGTESSLIDLGPGPARTVVKKILPILRALRKNLSTPLCHVLVDIARDYLKSGYDIVREDTKDITIFPIYPLLRDFKDISKEFNHIINAVYFLLGNTVSNFESSREHLNPDAIIFLTTFRKFMPDTKTRFIIGQDRNQNKQSLLKAYSNSAAARWMKNLLHRMERDAGVTFDPPLDKECSKWEYFARWNKKAHCMEMGVVAREKHMVMQDFRGVKQKYVIPKGRELHMWNSYKYPVYLFREILRLAGFETTEILFDKKDKLRRVALWVVRPGLRPPVAKYPALAAEHFFPKPA